MRAVRAFESYEKRSAGFWQRETFTGFKQGGRENRLAAEGDDGKRKRR